MQAYSVVIHGGAGDLARYAGTGRLEQASTFLKDLIDQLYRAIESGMPAIDVVTQACIQLEDSALFHAGRGSSPNTRGYVECDASIMNGIGRTAGAVAGLRSVKNPILAARYVMEQTNHVLMIADEARLLAENAQLEMVDETYFIPCDTAAVTTSGDAGFTGTVGAVALDKYGNIAAATSTGGTLNKTAGRVGDTPIIGAGTYAMNGVGAVSCTGVGEYFIRTSAAYAVISRMQLCGESILVATQAALQAVETLGGVGGIIAIDSSGGYSMPYNSSGMYRAVRTSLGDNEVGIL